MKKLLFDKILSLEEFVNEAKLPIVDVLRDMLGSALEGDEKVRFSSYSDDDIQTYFIQIYLFVLSPFVVEPLHGYVWTVTPCEYDCLKLTVYC